MHFKDFLKILAHSSIIIQIRLKTVLREQKSGVGKRNGTEKITRSRNETQRTGKPHETKRNNDII
jgi:hypothetical protein